MSKRIVDEYSNREDLSDKQKYALRYPAKIEEQKIRDSIRRKNNREKENASMREWRKNNPESIHKTNRNTRLKRYGLTEKSYGDLLELQNNVCAICGTDDSGCRTNKFTVKDWYIDHCHRTGKVRGLLCINCNTAIGSLKENPELFLAAIRYLNKSKEQIAEYEQGLSKKESDEW